MVHWNSFDRYVKRTVKLCLLSLMENEHDIAKWGNADEVALAALKSYYLSTFPRAKKRGHLLPVDLNPVDKMWTKYIARAGGTGTEQALKKEKKTRKRSLAQATGTGDCNQSNYATATATDTATIAIAGTDVVFKKRRCTGGGEGEPESALATIGCVDWVVGDLVCIVRGLLLPQARSLGNFLLTFKTKYSKQAKRNSRHNQLGQSRGQMCLGFTTGPGLQSESFLSKNIPYEYRAYQKIKREEEGGTWIADLQTVLDILWERAQSVFPTEARKMLRTSPHFTFGSTGFTTATVAWNDDVDKHKVGAKPSTIFIAHVISRLRETSFARHPQDLKNLDGGFAVVGVLSPDGFEGGNVTYHAGGRVISVENQGGDAFIGKYRVVPHEVSSITLVSLSEARSQARDQN